MQSKDFLEFLDGSVTEPSEADDKAKWAAVKNARVVA